MTRERRILSTRRGNFRWNDVELWILREWAKQNTSGQGWSQRQFVQLCAALGRSPRAVLECIRRQISEERLPASVLEHLPYTPVEIEQLNDELAIVGRSKDPSIKWVKAGQYGHPEHDAHKESNTLFGRHFGIYHAVKVIREALSTPPKPMVVEDVSWTHHMPYPVAGYDIAKNTIHERGWNDAMKYARMKLAEITPPAPPSSEAVVMGEDELAAILFDAHKLPGETWKTAHPDLRIMRLQQARALITAGVIKGGNRG